MVDASLQDRLREHAKAFDGLLSLIPAKLYYGNGDEPSEQWRRKKQTKEEKNAARRANLDPENELNKSVKEVMEERAARNKRKLAEMTGGAQRSSQSKKTESSSGDEEEEEEKEEEEDKDDDNDDNDSVDGNIVKEKPGEGLKKAKAEPPAAVNGETAAKKLKLTDAKDEEEKEKKEEKGDEDDEAVEQGISLEDANLSQKQQKKLLKKQAKAEKRAEKRKNKSDKTHGQDEEAKVEAEDVEGEEEQEAPKPKKDAKKKEKKDKKDKKEKKIEPKVVEADEDEAEAEVENDGDDDQEGSDFQAGVGFAALLGDEDVPSAPSSPAPSDTFDTPLPSTEAKETESITTSISSVSVPASFSSSLTTSATAATITTTQKSKLNVPSDTSALRARLAARIEALRAARKADVDELDSSGNVIRTRQQLIEARRQKQVERKQHKKELRRAARLEEDRKREEAVASARDSPLVRLSNGDDDHDDDNNSENAEIETNFAFGRIAFADGAKMSRDLSYVKEEGAAAAKKKGPASSDVKAQLARLESQKKRLAKMDDVQRRDIEEKERWLAARKRAEGVGRGDGGGLTAAAAASGAIATEGARHTTEQILKKAIKRKDKAKKKSEREWGERKEGVQKSIHERQKKREDNLRKRKEDKMLHRAGLSKKAKQGSGSKSKGGRPGFEGSSFGGRRK